jgi:hypothetical protein
MEWKLTWRTIDNPSESWRRWTKAKVPRDVHLVWVDLNAVYRKPYREIKAATD